jgi:hypothetical protein
MIGTAAVSQPVLIKRDSGTPAGAYYNAVSFMNESAIISFDGPCRVLELQIYYMGNNPARDTLYIVGDASEGAIPPDALGVGIQHPHSARDRIRLSRHAGLVHHRPAWDRTSAATGFDRIVVQHWLQRPVGPWFAVDSDKQVTPYWSFLMDPTQTNSLGGPGQYLLVTNDYMIRALVEYDFPNGNGSQPPPPPTLGDVAVSAGIHNQRQPEVKAAIASVGDWNNDGWDDINIGSHYFQNRGDGSFEYVTGALGLSAGFAVWGDFDNDGWDDAYIVNGGDNDKLYRNRRDGTFEDVTAASTISNPMPTVTPIWLDYNNDGHLDLFLANGRRTVAGQEVYYQDKLWRNEGDGSFTDVTSASGIAVAEPAPYDDCWGASACDYNNDGLTDIFVSTYRLAADKLYRNNGNGTFTDVGAATGVRGVPTQAPQYFGHGMGSDWGDFDNDGLMDLAVGNLGHPDWRGAVSNPSLIFHNDNTARFSEVHHDMGLKFREMNAGVLWADLDLDGWLDLWQSQYSYSKEGEGGEPGRYSRVYFNGGAPDFLLHDRTWLVGSKVHGAWTVSRLDYDRDGDIDLLVASQHEGVKLFRNDLPRKGRWLALRLSGSPADDVPMNAFGTRVVVHADGRMFTRTLSTSSAGSRTATNSTELHFGLGNAVSIDSVAIFYPNGARQQLTTLQPDKRYTIAYNGQISTGIGELSDAAWDIAQAQYSRGLIRFSLKSEFPLAGAQIDLYNALGQRVFSLVAEELSPGMRTFSVPARLSSGLHMLTLRSGAITRSARVLVAH